MPEFAGSNWTWDAFYHSEAQGWWLLWLAPLAFLIYRASIARLPALGIRAEEPAARFVDRFAMVFALETLLDPVATGPLLRAAGLYDHAVGTAVMFLFVYLGDFRVLVLLMGLARPALLSVTIRRAALATLAVPALSGVVYGTLSALHPALHGQWQWIIYELSFMALSLGIRGGWLPVLNWLDDAPSDALRRYLRQVCGYVAGYYALWAASDLLILLGGLDFGWATRALANQLYYAFFVPFVWFRYRSLVSRR